jgi:hypothetical protein
MVIMLSIITWCSKRKYPGWFLAEPENNGSSFKFDACLCPPNKEGSTVIHLFFSLAIDPYLVQTDVNGTNA